MPHHKTAPMRGDPNVMTSLVRGLCVVQSFSRQTPTMTIAQISQKTDIPRAAVRRCLYTLCALGFADSQDGRYFLRPRILSLGHSYLSSIPITAVAQPLLDRISEKLNESCSIAVLDGSDIVYIARESVTRIMSVDLSIGSRLPAAFTSMGRVLLAYQVEDLDEYIATQVDFQPFTPNTLTDARALRADIEAVRTAGYSIVNQELETGLRSIAVPIANSQGKAYAAINVGAHATRLSMEDLKERVLPLLREAAAELSLYT